MQTPTPASSSATPLLLPAAWQTRLAGCRLHAQSIGASRAQVYRLQRHDGPDTFLKSEPADAFSELPDEVARLRWLQGQGIAAPEVLETLEQDGRHWLWMTGVPGVGLASVSLPPVQVVAILAGALKRLHALPVAGCPFDQGVQHRLAAARVRVQARQVDETDFDDPQQGQSAQQVLATLLVQLPGEADAVVTHGDACLQNLLAAHGGFSGFIDCARLGVADRHQDLALAARSIAHVLGQAWVAPFFAHYGIAPDAQRLSFYCLLDELF